MIIRIHKISYKTESRHKISIEKCNKYRYNYKRKNADTNELQYVFTMYRKILRRVEIHNI